MLCPFLQIMWMDIALAPPPSPVHLGGPESRGVPKVHASPAEGPADHPSARPSPPHAWRSLCLFPPSPKVCACSPTPLSLYSIFPHTHYPFPPSACFPLIKGYKEEGGGFIAVFALIWLHLFLFNALFFTLLERLVTSTVLLCHTGNLPLFYQTGACEAYAPNCFKLT